MTKTTKTKSNPKYFNNDISIYELFMREPECLKIFSSRDEECLTYSIIEYILNRNYNNRSKAGKPAVMTFSTIKKKFEPLYDLILIGTVLDKLKDIGIIEFDQYGQTLLNADLYTLIEYQQLKRVGRHHDFTTNFDTLYTWLYSLNSINQIQRIGSGVSDKEVEPIEKITEQSQSKELSVVLKEGPLLKDNYTPRPNPALDEAIAKYGLTK